ncbi:unnamed protein product, partial [Prunus brigantina]
ISFSEIGFSLNSLGPISLFSPSLSVAQLSHRVTLSLSLTQSSFSLSSGCSSKLNSTIDIHEFGQEDILSSLVADACVQVCPKNPANFNVDNVRVAKIVGGGLHNCTVVRGMVLKTDAVGSIKRMEKAKVLCSQVCCRCCLHCSTSRSAYGPSKRDQPAGMDDD